MGSLKSNPDKRAVSARRSRSPCGKVNRMTDQVFLIDDDESFLRSMQRRLFAYGLQVQSFRSAQDFLSQVPLDCEGCILLDIQMPG
ncbi:MAG: response regulator, partial [Planctomycetaceae bacterium]